MGPLLGCRIFHKRLYPTKPQHPPGTEAAMEALKWAIRSPYICGRIFKLAKIPWKLERDYQRLFDLLSILMELQWRRRTPVLLHAVLSGLHRRHKDNHYRSTIFFFKNIGQIVYWYIKKQTTLLSFHSTFLWTMLRRWAGQRTTIVSCKMVKWPTVLRSNHQKHSE